MIRLNRFIPLFIFNNELMVTQAFMQCLMSMTPCQFFGEARQVIPIISSYWLSRPSDCFNRKLLEPRFGYLKRSMWPIETDRHEKRFLSHRFPLLVCPLSNLIVSHLLIWYIERVAVRRWIPAPESVLSHWRPWVFGLFKQ